MMITKSITIIHPYPMSKKTEMQYWLTDNGKTPQTSSIPDQTLDTFLANTIISISQTGKRVKTTKFFMMTIKKIEPQETATQYQSRAYNNIPINISKYDSNLRGHVELYMYGYFYHLIRHKDSMIVNISLDQQYIEFK